MPIKKIPLLLIIFSIGSLLADTEKLINNISVDLSGATESELRALAEDALCEKNDIGLVRCTDEQYKKVESVLSSDKKSCVIPESYRDPTQYQAGCSRVIVKFGHFTYDNCIPGTLNNSASSIGAICISSLSERQASASPEAQAEVITEVSPPGVPRIFIPTTAPNGH